MNEEKLPQSYKKFESAVGGLRDNIKNAEVLGSGSESNVYKLRLGDGLYAVKLARLYLHQ